MLLAVKVFGQPSTILRTLSCADANFPGLIYSNPLLKNLKVAIFPLFQNLVINHKFGVFEALFVFLNWNSQLAT